MHQVPLVVTRGSSSSATRPRKSGFSKTIHEADTSLVTSLSCRPDRWTEHLRFQFGQPPTVPTSPNSSTLPLWLVSDGPWTKAEIRSELQVLEWREAYEPNDIRPALSKDGELILLNSLNSWTSGPSLISSTEQHCGPVCLGAKCPKSTFPF